MTLAKQPVLPRKIPLLVQNHLKVIHSKNNQSVQEWNKEKKKLLTDCMISVNRLDQLLRNAEKRFQPLFSNKTIKNILFRMFYGNGKRIGKYFYLALFESSEEVSVGGRSFSPDRLVIAWNIRTTEISFKLVRDLSGNTGSGECIINNLFSQEEILATRKLFLESHYSHKQELLDISKQCNEKKAFFVEKIIQAGFFATEQSLFEKILKDYSVHLQNKDTAKIVFSRRCSKKVTFGDGKKTEAHLSGIRDCIKGYDNITYKILKEINEALLDGGYPDSQKALIDLRVYDDNKRDQRPLMQIKTVAYIRKEIASYSHNDFDDIDSDEPNNYKAYSSLND